MQTPRSVPPAVSYTHLLAGRLKKISSVVLGITDPFILDNYYVWFKNNCPLDGPLYDDVRFEPLTGERDGKYFVVSLDSPHERMKWALVTERYGYDAPEFECGNVRDMVKYINAIAPELAQGIQPRFVLEKAAVGEYVRQHEGKAAYSIQMCIRDSVKPAAASTPTWPRRTTAT